MRIMNRTIQVYHPYPIAAGSHLGYRCFDGKSWHDCKNTSKNCSNCNMRHHQVEQHRYFK